MRTERHLVLAIELPCMYVADIAELREFGDPDESESDHILNCIGEPGTVILTTEISGEKDSEVISVYGDIREASLVPPTLAAGKPITDEQLREHGSKLEGEPEEAIHDAVKTMRRARISDEDIRDDLMWQLTRLRRQEPSAP